MKPKAANYLATACLAAASLALPAFANPESFTIDSSHTFPSFEVSHLGFSIHRGRFNKTEGKVTLDTAAKSGSIDITIDTNSIDTGGDKMDAHLRNEDFFNVAKFPTITFKSNKLKFDGAALTGADGDLTILGVTKPVSLTATGFKCGVHPFNKKNVCGANVSTTIKRSDFGMKYGVPGIGDEVKILIQVEAVKG